MAVYDRYVNRKRVRVGVGVKLRQSRVIFELGQRWGSAECRKVLEIGPGDGQLAALARSAGLPYTAVEGNPAVAQALRDRGVEVMDGYVPPLPAGLGAPFGFCYMLHVLEHMNSAQSASRLMTDIYQLLAPGGALVIACPDYRRWGADFYDCDYTHTYPVTRRRLLQLAHDHGYEMVHQTVYIGPLFGVHGLTISSLARLLYPRWVDGILGASISSDVLNRGLLTFLPNLLAVMRRPT